MKYEYSNPQHQNMLKQLTRQLREKSGRGFMTCRKALIQTNLDIDKALKLLNRDQKYFFIKDHIEYK